MLNINKNKSAKRLPEWRENNLLSKTIRNETPAIKIKETKKIEETKKPLTIIENIKPKYKPNLKESKKPLTLNYESTDEDNIEITNNINENLDGLIKVETLDKNLLPKWITTSMEYISLNVNKAPDSLFLGHTLKKAFELASYNRVAGNDGKNISHTNGFFAVFIESGIGKDYAGSVLNLAYSNVERERLIFQKEIHDAMRVVLEDEARKKFPGDTKKQNEFVNDHEPRDFNIVTTTGTREGLLADMEAFMNNNFGCLTVHVSELGDLIASNSESQKQYFGLIKEYYESTHKDRKSVSSRNTKTITGVPLNLWAHTSPESLMSGKGKQQLLEFFQRGNYRRNFVIFPKKTEYKTNIIETIDLDKIMEEAERNKNKSDALLNDLKEYYLNVHKELNSALNLDIDLEDAFNLELKFGKVFNMTKKAFKLYTSYELYTNNIWSTKHLSNQFDGKEEVTSRIRRTFKLATMLASVSHPKDAKITVHDMRAAIHLNEFFATSFETFMFEQNKEYSNKLFEFFLENKGKAFSKMEIRDLKVISCQSSKYTSIFNDLLSSAIEEAEEKGYELVEEIFKPEGKGRPTTKYKLIDYVGEDLGEL